MTTSLERAKELINDSAYREDFLQGGGKNGTRDKLRAQQPSTRTILTDEDISSLYATNSIIQNIIDIPAEDMTRNWFTLRCSDDQLGKNIMSKLADLKAKNAFKKMRQYERLRGDGFISLGVTQKNPFTLYDPLDEKRLKSIDYIHPFSSLKVAEFLMNDDVFSNDYGKLEAVRIDRTSRHGVQQIGLGQSEVHISRLLHDQTRRLEEDEKGQSLLEPMYDIIKVFDTSVWSVGQILYDFTMKVYKSKDIDGMEAKDKQQLSMIMDFLFRTEALALIAEDESLEKQSTNVSGIDKLLDYGWDLLASASRMPKTVLKGQEAGTIAGAQYDVMNYYARIAAAQENEMTPHAERLIRLIMQSEEMGSIDPDSLEWEVKWNPLWQVDSKTDAEIRKLIAETDNIYITNGVLVVDDVRKARFGQFGLTDELKFSGDSADYEGLAKSVYEGYQNDKT